MDVKTQKSISKGFRHTETIVVYPGDCLYFLKQLPSATVSLIVTSPPYNIGKEYEKKLALDTYLEQQAAVIHECVRVLKPEGRICWQVGNYVEKGSIVPLDTVLYPTFIKEGLRLRNRIIWHFEHGLHCSRRFSGRYETINWFTRSEKYFFNLDPIRVPQKYPDKKYFKGPKVGEYSCNPLGKNPGDLWIIPNVKSNHIEKTQHPCQFPVELIERLVLSMTQENEWVLDPFLGTGTSIIAAVRHGRRGMGAETLSDYVNLAKKRILLELNGTLKTRSMHKPIYEPVRDSSRLATPQQKAGYNDARQEVLFEYKTSE